MRNFFIPLIDRFCLKKRPIEVFRRYYKDKGSQILFTNGNLTVLYKLLQCPTKFLTKTGLKHVQATKSNRFCETRSSQLPPASIYFIFLFSHHIFIIFNLLKMILLFFASFQTIPNTLKTNFFISGQQTSQPTKLTTQDKI